MEFLFIQRLHQSQGFLQQEMCMTPCIGRQSLQRDLGAWLRLMLKNGWRKHMGEVLYQTDSYLKEFSATVVSVSDSKFVVLDKTAFYPTSGGQQHDTGTLVGDDGTTYPVVFVGKFSGNISHEIDPAGKPEIMAGGEEKR